MILGLGTDIVENERIENLFRQHGRKFLERVFTEEEVEYALSHEDPVPFLAARFAVKEAFVKALNIRGASGMRLKDVEVAGKIFGKKSLKLYGKAKRMAEEMGALHYHISLSHSKASSLAVVILEN